MLPVLLEVCWWWYLFVVVLVAGQSDDARWKKCRTDAESLLQQSE
jgi:hypothetical protein